MATSNSAPVNYPLIRVLVADGTPMGSRLIYEALKRCPRFDLIPPVTGTFELLQIASKEKPHVAVITNNLEDDPAKSFKALREFRASCPKTKPVMLLDYPKHNLVVGAFRAGARGVYCQDGSIEDLYKCICCVNLGQLWANTKEMDMILKGLSERAPAQLVNAKGASLLSEREREVVRYTAQGLTNREIAAQMKLSEHTVKNYLFRIFDKLGVSNRVEMIFCASGQASSTETPNVSPGAGSDLPKADVGTFELYRKAAEEGFGFGQFVLGQIYRDGRGVPQDRLSAYMWFLVAEHTSDYLLKTISEAKARLARRLRDDQIAEAQRRASEWLNEHPEQAKLLTSPFLEADKSRC